MNVNVTLNCKCCSQLDDYKNTLYEGVGNVVELSKYSDKNIKAHLVSTGRVVWAVSSGHPILVDSCKGGEHIVEMDLSSRYVVVGEEMRRKKFYPTIKRLFERKIYTLTEVERPDLDAVKSKLVKSYYSNDGKLRDSTFEHNLSPINMAEAGIGFLGGGFVYCHYCHYYYHNPFMPLSVGCGCQSSPEIMHQKLFKGPPCIEFRKYHYPVLTTESGEDVTGATYRMIIPGAVGGHTKTGCSSSVLVTEKNYELPVLDLDSQEIKHEVELANIERLKQRIRFMARRGKFRLSYFTEKVQQVIYRVHFKPLFVQLKLETDRFIRLLNQFQVQVADEEDKEDIKEKKEGIAMSLREAGIEKEVDKFVKAIADYEMISTFSKVIKRCADRENVERSNAIDRAVVEEELAKLDEIYSNQYFLNNFFNSSVCSADFNDLFCDYQHYFWTKSDSSQVIVDMNDARTELLKSINAVHTKVKELLSIYLKAGKGDWGQVFDFS